MTTEPMSAEPVRASQGELHPAGQQLHIKGAGVDRLLQPGSTYRIGRDPQADIPVSDTRVSWQHAILERDDSGWRLQDAGSTNGTFADGQRVRQVAISVTCAVRLGHPEDGPLLRCTLIGVPAPADEVPEKVQAATAVRADGSAAGGPAAAPAAPLPAALVPGSPAPAAAAPSRSTSSSRI